MTGALTFCEKVRFRLRNVEHVKLPRPFRKVLIQILADPYERRTTRLEDGREIIFFHVPKTGGTSLAGALGLRYGHVPATRFQMADPDRFERAFKVAFVRDPVDRLFYSFNYLRTAIGLNKSPDVRWSESYLADYQSFEDFVSALQNRSVRRRIMEWPHFRPMHSWLCRPGDTFPMVDFLGRFETLSDDTASLAANLGVSMEQPHRRKPQGYLDKKITPDMIKSIRGIYRNDVEIFGY